jgi:hypothetical protein
VAGAALCPLSAAPVVGSDMGRTANIWTWDVGRRAVDLDDEAALLAPILQTILDGSLWTEFRKFPPHVLVRLLPDLDVDLATRRLIEIFVEEARHHTA